MMTFKEHEFWDFLKSVNSQFRFTRTSEQASFLASLEEGARRRTVSLSEGTIGYRAQIGNAWVGEKKDTPVSHSAERMKPRAEFASDGRINPRGIPYLYLSSDPRTAALEVRPQIGSLVTIAEFKLLRDSELVDFSRCAYPEPDIYDFRYKKKDMHDVEEMVWASVSRLFSTPAALSVASTDYVPTQVIAESLRAAGHAGIAYKSSYEPHGRNFALFDLNCAIVVQRSLFRVADLSIKLERADNTIWHRFLEED